MWSLNYKKLIGCGLVLVCLGSCYTDKEDLLYGTTKCDTTTVSFSSDILPIVTNSCAIVGCHIQNGNAPSIFENYNQIKASVSSGSIVLRAITRRDMPPAGPLTACQIEHLQKWIDDGAKNN